MPVRPLDTLVVISVPFSRNARYTLTSTIFEQLKATYDVLVVGPDFKDESSRTEFGGARVSFWAFDEDPQRLPRVARSLYAVSELLRRNGYLLRFRNRGLRYYWDTLTRGAVDPAGKRVPPSLVKRLNWPMALLGYPRFAWMALDRLFGRFMFNTRELSDRIKGYSHVVIVQTANWGYQERYFAYGARRFSLRSILAPYTTDQLITNGYLVSSYDSICTQGPVESRYAMNYHRVPEDRVLPLGMIWRRNIEAIQRGEGVASAGKVRPPGAKVILYAGLAPMYFPRTSEFQAIQAILEAMHDGSLPAATLVYRPVVEDAADAEAIAARYAADPRVVIQLPQAALIGIDQPTAGSVRAQVIEYLEQIAAVDVLVMSATTTILFDSLHFDIPCVANFTDPSGMLRESGFSTTYVENDETLRGSRSMPVAYSFDELIRHIRSVLLNPESVKKVKEEVFGTWDHQTPEYVSRFVDLIESLRTSSSSVTAAGSKRWSAIS